MGTLGRVMVLAAVAMIVAAGLCVFDAEGTGPDLCLTVLAVTVGWLFTAPLVLTGRSVPGRAHAYQLILSDRPAPPPKR